MSIRSIVFWSHLTTGVVAGLIVLSLSVSGVLLTYERQIIQLSERNLFTVPVSSSQLSVDELLEHAKLVTTEPGGLSLVFRDNRSLPAVITSGQTQVGLINPYNGEVLRLGQSQTQAVFHWITEFHRWFAVDSDSRGVAKSITGAANIGFLFLLLTGAWLWLPKIAKWPMFRTRLFLKKQPNSKARDFHWHHVFAAWSFIPLLVIILTATVFSYTWSNNLVFSAFGETASIRKSMRGAQGSASAERTETSLSEIKSAGIAKASLQDLYEKAQQHNPDWHSIKISAPKSVTADVSMQLDTSNSGGQPTKLSTLVFSRSSGKLIKEETFADKTPATQARFYIRFLHTGEALGILGQTAAGLASILACILVYTGLMLAYRRLVKPLFVRRALLH